ncbi:uncharacterized protein [Magallana gigas]|uniref:uncharacterized protein n=1 Tax=Magallana gigas TaxID=29159 RepID=UPI003341BC22
MNGEEFLRSIETRLARMGEIANAFHEYQTDNFRRELEDKQFRPRIAKTTACCNKSQDDRTTENDEISKLLKIYDPDRETELADVFRYREYSEDLETIEEIVPRYYDIEDTCSKEFASKCKHKTEYLNWLRHQSLYIEETDKRNDDDQVESNEKFAVEFRTGAEYLQWLELQLPYAEPFLPKDETHYYFFRKWRKDDLKYYSEMEYFNEMENEDDEDEIEGDNFDLNFSRLEPTNGETKPEFGSGRQLVEWLERRLEYIEPFAPNDAVHFYFKRTWSREKFVATVDTLEEMENEDDEEVLETEVSHQNVSQLLIEPTNEETKPEFDSGRQLMEWLGKRLEYIEPFAPNDAVHFYFKRRWSREKFVASLTVVEERETVEETKEEEVHIAPPIEHNSSSTEDEENMNVYISLMSRPMALDGFKLEEKTQEHVRDKPLLGDVTEHVVMETTIKNEVLAAGPQMEPLKKESNSSEERKIKKQQKKRHSFLRRLFGRS